MSVLAHCDDKKARLVMHRSLLFVPGDRPDRFLKASASGADALILDLEDSVLADRKAYARSAIAEWMRESRHQETYIRINPLNGEYCPSDLECILSSKPDAVMLPKAEGATSIGALLLLLGTDIPILPIATETPSAIFEIGSYRTVASKLRGLTWGAEDLPAAIGASRSRDLQGYYTAPYELARSLTLFGAHACDVPAIETVYPSISDLSGLASYVNRARRDGFSGMMAIHPHQIAIINDGFTPSSEELAEAEAIVAAFRNCTGSHGVVQFNGRMLDAPHLKQAQRILARSHTITDVLPPRCPLSPDL